MMGGRRARPSCACYMPQAISYKPYKTPSVAQYKKVYNEIEQLIIKNKYLTIKD